jgi:hypothetical protein
VSGLALRFVSRYYELLISVKKLIRNSVVFYFSEQPNKVSTVTGSDSA